MQTNFDIIIIGTGAGGGTLAYALAPTGKRILLLERGDYIPREKRNWSPEEIYIDGLYRTDESWLNPQGNKFKPNLYHRVGGSTKVYGAALLRMRPQDFEELHFFGGVSPAWSLKYADFEPYYTQAERIYNVHGNRGEDPIEPPSTTDYPYPALPHEPQIQQVANRLEKLGLRPFSLPMGIKRDVNNSRESPCIRCDTCDGYPCLLNAKADAQTCCVDPALKYENVTLINNADVQRLIADNNQVTSIEVLMGENKEYLSADIVVVACGAINSAALLLRSANSNHPHGLANSSGLVGCNLMKHNVTKIHAISPELNTTVFQKTLGVNDFYFGNSQDSHPLGHVHLMGKHKWQTMRPDFPNWMPQSLLEFIANRSVDWWAQSEDLPRVNNRVEIDSQGRIKVNYQPNNQQTHKILKQRFKSVLKQAGFPLTLEVAMPLKIMNHQVGTCKFGTNPQNSVLDLNCRTHDVDNLYVVDSSFFPSISAVNPTLTIAANALRVGSHLQERLNASLTTVDTAA